MKKITTLLMAFVMLLSMSVFTYADSSDEEAFVNQINSASSYSQIIPLLETERPILNLSPQIWSLYDTLPNKGMVAQGLLARNFNSITEIRNVFTNLVMNAATPPASPGGGGTGGGGDYPVRLDVSYMVEKAVFYDDNTIQATITLVGDRKDESDFGSFLFLAAYTNDGMRLENVEIIPLELESPFYSDGRATITSCVLIDERLPEEEYIVKAIMLTSAETLQPTCIAPHRFNECVVKENDKATLSVITVEGMIRELPLGRDDRYVRAGYKSIDAKAKAAGWYINYESNANSLYQVPYTLFFDDSIDLIPLLGLYITMQIDVSDDSAPTLISAVKKAGKNIYKDVDPTLLSSKGSGYDSYGYARYYPTSKDYMTSSLTLNKDISGNVDVTVYNNLVLDYPNYSLSGSAVSIGGNMGDILYRFVDTDADGDYDTVFVINEKAFVIGSVNTTTNRINRDTDTANSATTFNKAFLILNPSDNTMNWSMSDKDGIPLTISDLSAGQVANVRVSTTGPIDYYEIIITDNVISGMVEVVSTDTNIITGFYESYFEIGGVEYKLFPGLNTLKPGNIVTAMIANDGKIIAYKTNVEQRKYGLILATNVAESFGRIFQLQIMTSDGNIAILNLNKRLNGATTDIYSSYPYLSAAHAAFQADYPTGSLAVYETNTANEIKNIRIGSSVSSLDPNLSGKTIINGVYMESSKRISSYYFDNNTYFFATEASNPSQITDDNVILSTPSVLEDGVNYTGFAIVQDGIMKAVMLYETGTAISWNSFPMVITNKSSVSVGGETRIRYAGFIDGVLTYITVAANKDINYAVNDILLYSLNALGEMTNAFKMGGFNNYSNSYDVKVANTYDEENKIEVTYTPYSLSTARCPNVIDAVVYGMQSYNDYMKGFSIAGKAFEVRGRTLRIINDYAATFNNPAYQTGVRGYGVTTSDEDYIYDYSFNSSINVYVYNAVTKKMRVTTIGELMTDKSSLDYTVVGASPYASTYKTEGRDNDDSVYLYKYDGTTRLVLIIDAAGDNN